jgi:hypothetical protein
VTTFALRATVDILHGPADPFEGRDRSGDFYVVDIWKKSGEGWQMIAHYRDRRSARQRGRSEAALRALPR